MDANTNDALPIESVVSDGKSPESLPENLPTSKSTFLTEKEESAYQLNMRIIRNALLNAEHGIHYVIVNKKIHVMHGTWSIIENMLGLMHSTSDVIQEKITIGENSYVKFSKTCVIMQKSNGRELFSDTASITVDEKVGFPSAYELNKALLKLGTVAFVRCMHSNYRAFGVELCRNVIAKNKKTPLEIGANFEEMTIQQKKQAIQSLPLKERIDKAERRIKATLYDLSHFDLSENDKKHIDTLVKKLSEIKDATSKDLDYATLYYTYAIFLVHKYWLQLAGEELFNDEKFKDDSFSKSIDDALKRARKYAEPSNDKGIIDLTKEMKILFNDYKKMKKPTPLENKGTPIRK